MMYTILACFIRRIISDKKEYVYRDELIINKPLVPLPRKAVKKSVRFADSEYDEKKDLVKGRCDNEVGIRVKVKMTKEEAARLLSKCKEGGVLEFKDVARQLVALPINRVTVLSTCNN